MKLLGFLVLTALLSSCIPPVDKGPLVYRGAFTLNAAALADLTGFLKSKNCQQCHAWVNNQNELLSRVEPGNPDASRVYARVLDGTMPKDGTPLTTAELELVRSFIVALTAPGTTPTVQPAPVTGYALVKQTFVDAKCVTCHKGLDNEATIPGAWLVRGDAAKSPFYKAITRTDKPTMPKWYPENTAAELELVRDYIHDKGKPDAKVVFAEVFEKVLKVKCLKCHNHKGFDTEEGIAWAVKDGDPAGSRLYVAMENGSMPKQLPKTTPEDALVLKAYIDGLTSPVRQ